jgi:xanthine/CO dehydrogenase XdhC/CoxF family maturation factor
MAADAIDRLVCPIGLTSIRDKAPAVIAASVVTQVLMRRQEVQAETTNTRNVNPGSGRTRHG